MIVYDTVSCHQSGHDLFCVFLQGLSVVGVQQIDRVLEVVEETLKGNLTFKNKPK